MLEFIRRNAFMLLGLVAALFIGGLLTIPGLPVEPVPDISPQQVMVSVTAPGLATEEVERLITFPLESSLTGIPGVVDLRSISRTGVSAVYLQFGDSTDIEIDRSRVSQRLLLARDAISVPGISIAMGPLATGMGEIMQIQIKGDGYSLMDLNRIMTWTVVPQLRLVPGVVDVNVNGGAEETFQLTLDPSRMIAFGVSVRDIMQAIDSNNASAGGGWIAHQDEQQVIVARARVGGLAALGAIPVKMGRAGHVIRVRDMGVVETGARTRLGAVTRDGQGEIVNGVVLMQNGASSNATLAAINEALPGIRKSLPAGVTLDPFYTRATLTSETIGTVKENLALGAGLVVVVLVLVLGDWRAAIVIASVIPAALVFAMAGMRWFGVSANLLSLGAIDFGMIVDSSLVVVEHLLATSDKASDRRTFRDLARSALAVVIRPVSFAILIIILVYLPILTLEGIEGKMFRPMAQTVIMALVASLLYCIVCVPTVAALVMRFGGEDRETRFLRFIRRYYEPALAWSEHHGRLLIAITAGAFMIAVFLATRLGGEFVPQLDEGALLVTSMRLPSASLDTVVRGVTEQERILKSFPDVATVVSNTGTSAIPTDPMGTGETDTFIFLKPRGQWKTARTEAGIVEKMSEALAERLPDADYSWTQPIQMRMDDLLSGVRTQLAISIYGDDLETLSGLADETVAAVNSVRGAADVTSAGEGTVPYMHVDVDRDAAARLGVAVPDILQTIEAVGGRIGTTVTLDEAIIPTQVRFVHDAVRSADRIGRLQVRRADGNGWVLLGDVAHISILNGTSRIDRDSLRRRVIVQANVRGRDVASFVSEARKAVTDKVHLPPGYRMAWSGQFRNLESAMHRLGVVLPIVLALIFGLLVAALSSFGMAALVFVNLPVAATGGIVALVLRGMPFSIAAGIGFIALFGVAILNGVVLMSQIANYRQEGMDAAKAAFEAARVRLRPVIATASVASLGFFPMAFSGSAGAEVERPLATVVIGGLMSSTLLTLLVLPSLYALAFGRGTRRSSDAVQS
ncbi:cobalt/zinc/cadmium resistance heavy metal efflux pump protein CzcA [Acetobacter indonesiensis NRIC 0313]|uniref:Cation transporter n=1 Tax=Acetobacter indonesiensis TaxID=104101 RepID=A0A6N3T8B7_9PROT|nr:CusA/CzcA family heavy metal efflux RND transporter [Acetobacter indonesiensis]GAN63334.1 heavy metal efflux pump, cobalt/zinc/cadmium resistance protein CzcA [Acetobacter indonesiensis]GBQ61997.1 cobalt/zinc/cadmium resistance heavy metal efflux pump protein CzcA [Acetobacter indonesiensis NRIC 0313]GEN03837.1 cation transporter [Acetobacter indonesiensis]